MSKIQALMKHLEIDDSENIINSYGNCYEYNGEEYEIMDEEEVISYGKDLIDGDLDEILFQSVPKYLHKYFNREEYINDRVDEAFEYVDFGSGYYDVEDDNGNLYFIFPI